MPRHSFAKPISERDWLKSAARTWDLVKKSPVLADYSKMLQSSGLYRWSCSWKWRHQLWVLCMAKPSSSGSFPLGKSSWGCLRCCYKRLSKEVSPDAAVILEEEAKQKSPPQMLLFVTKGHVLFAYSLITKIVAFSWRRPLAVNGFGQTLAKFVGSSKKISFSILNQGSGQPHLDWLIHYGFVIWIRRS